jgi:hypothetical protein
MPAMRWPMSPPGSAARVILVTGSPRSGTTAVGQALAIGATSCTLHEPFNYHVGLRSIERYFEIPGTAGFAVEDLGRHVDGIRRLELRFKSGVFPDDRGLRRLVKKLVGGRSRASYRMCKLHKNLDTILWKDPFACFCVDLLADVHNIPVVVTVRNPWAVAASFKRMGWRFDVRDIIARATEAGFLPAGDGLATYPDLDNPPINAAILWEVIYSRLLNWSRGRSIFLASLDDIVDRPLAAYRSLFARLALPWSEEVAARIAEMYESRSERVLPREKRAHDRKRDLRSINSYWQELLGEREARTVGELTGSTWERIRAACLPLEPREPPAEARE